MDDQGCAELGDSIPGRRARALPIAMPVDRCTASAMAFWRMVGSEGRAETGTRFIRRESEVGAGDDSIIRLACLCVLVPLVTPLELAWVVRDGAEATWHTAFLDILSAGRFAND